MAIYYNPDIFVAKDEAHARRVILTDEGPGADTDSRWVHETPHILRLILEALGLQPDMLIIDYGCGIGRMSKVIIDTIGCNVVGVDISPSMRRLAADYVKSDRFMAISPSELDILTRGGLRAHAGISIWVLQHCLDPKTDIVRIHNVLKDDGRLFVVNMNKRAVPVIEEIIGAPAKVGWAVDNIDIPSLLRSTFHVLGEGNPADSSVPNMADAGAFWMNLIKP